MKSRNRLFSRPGRVAPGMTLAAKAVIDRDGHTLLASGNGCSLPK